MEFFLAKRVLIWKKDPHYSKERNRRLYAQQTEREGGRKFFFKSAKANERRERQREWKKKDANQPHDFFVRFYAQHRHTTISLLLTCAEYYVFSSFTHLFKLP